MLTLCLTKKEINWSNIQTTRHTPSWTFWVSAALFTNYSFSLALVTHTKIDRLAKTVTHRFIPTSWQHSTNTKFNFSKLPTKWQNRGPSLLSPFKHPQTEMPKVHYSMYYPSLYLNMFNQWGLW